MRVAFIVGEFPVISETFIINQICDLIDRGIDVQIFSFKRGTQKHIAGRYAEYKLSRRAHYLWAPRIVWSSRWLTALFQASSFSGRRFDLIHCHFGPTANKYLFIRKILRDTTPMLTTFYGYDVSHIPKEKGPQYYDALKKECSRFVVMSENMKERVGLLGFPKEQITVLPVSLAMDGYRYLPHLRKGDEPVQFITIGRLVEKKGIDDLLKAIALLKKKTSVPFHQTIVGDGPLRDTLHTLAGALGLPGVVSFTGALPLEEINILMQGAHLYVQPSKTAQDGDME